MPTPEQRSRVMKQVWAWKRPKPSTLVTFYRGEEVARRMLFTAKETRETMKEPIEREARKLGATRATLTKGNYSIQGSYRNGHRYEFIPDRGGPTIIADDVWLSRADFLAPSGI